MSFDYQSFYSLMRKGGLDHETASACAEQELDLHQKLDTLLCPFCNGQLDKKRDSRQTGASSVRGDWFSYRCQCGFVCDRKEEIS